LKPFVTTGMSLKPPYLAEFDKSKHRTLVKVGSQQGRLTALLGVMLTWPRRDGYAGSCAQNQLAFSQG
jgi:hypothetical protein